jgi:hypothetical protein
VFSHVHGAVDSDVAQALYEFALDVPDGPDLADDRFYETHRAVRKVLETVVDPDVYYRLRPEGDPRKSVWFGNSLASNPFSFLFEGTTHE